MPAAIVIPVGTRFGRAVTTGEPYSAPLPSGHLKRFVALRCDCGNTFVTQVALLRSGHTRSCGCLHSEMTSAAHRIDCEHPACTGNHGKQGPIATWCPVTRARNAEWKRKDWYDNPEKGHARNAKYYSEHRDELLESNHKYYSENAEALREYGRKWSVANPLKVYLNNQAATTRARKAKMEALTK